ncbi:hypothetical protein [Melittangium boletus]|uniref:Uncharacterized protein n=1 Tax=Melittangium boletus DSM 14713 TaxID=1294270 RepID=A0A250IIG6_9BACT|nr:hypothetical protein [Melittangium boletus]ATB30961.1 hypothetical protein MEBOL_004423 [Melittangium boletus DSM 14713]
MHVRTRSFAMDRSSGFVGLLLLCLGGCGGPEDAAPLVAEVTSALTPHVYTDPPHALGVLRATHDPRRLRQSHGE